MRPAPHVCTPPAPLIRANPSCSSPCHRGANAGHLLDIGTRWWGCHPLRGVCVEQLTTARPQARMPRPGEQQYPARTCAACLCFALSVCRLVRRAHSSGAACLVPQSWRPPYVVTGCILSPRHARTPRATAPCPGLPSKSPTQVPSSPPCPRHKSRPLATRTDDTHFPAARVEPCSSSPSHRSARAGHLLNVRARWRRFHRPQRRRVEEPSCACRALQLIPFTP